MPALSPTMVEGVIDSFHVSVGDEVTAGDSLAAIRTDKATMEFETQDEGFVAWIGQSLVGEVTPVGQICMILVEEESDLAAFKNFDPSHLEQSTASKQSAPVDTVSESTEEPVLVTATATSSSSPSGKKVFISPRALKKLESEGFTKEKLQARLDSSNCPLLKGSGPNDRIIEQDIPNVVKSLNLKPKQAEPAPKKQVEKPPQATQATQATQAAPLSGQVYKEIELTTMRRVIAERLGESKREIPHYYLEMEIVMDSLLRVKKEIFENTGVKVSVNDFIVKAVAKACKAVPETNTHFVNGKIRQFEDVDVR